jgi:disulfide bond formation protein DsbB
LFYSEVAGYPPCTLCWYQRIATYPLVVVIGVAAVRRDRSVWLPASILAGIGGAISVWHLVIERNPVLGGACDPSNPCAILWVQEFGFLTIPAMALIGVLAIGLFLMVPTIAALFGFTALLAGIEIQVRKVEEPWLRDEFGEEYASYASRVGRFLPGLGLDR